jgi:hypothetical protein
VQRVWAGTSPPAQQRAVDLLAEMRPGEENAPAAGAKPIRPIGYRKPVAPTLDAVGDAAREVTNEAADQRTRAGLTHR